MSRSCNEYSLPGSISLAGAWRLALDSEGKGVSENWFQKRFSDPVELPGSLDVQGIGNPVSVDTEWTGTIFDRSYFNADRYEPYRQEGNIKVPFWLQPETRYVGAAWYQREFVVPEDWDEKQCFLFLERPHWSVRVWLDERELVGTDSLSTGVRIGLGKLEIGRPYKLTLCVDNRVSIPVGENAHSISDHTQGNWNGIVGRIELLATGESWIERVEIYPRVEDRLIRVVGLLGGSRPADAEVELGVRELFGSGVRVASTLLPVSGSGRFETRIELGSDARLWSEFDPALYELEVGYAGDRKTEVFGLSEFSTKGTQFFINGSTTILRGVLDCCIFPLNGHPPMEQMEWRRILGTIKDCGFNHVRFHSWCPPEAAFQVGDKLGLYFQVECSVWPNSEAVLAFNSPEGIGDGKLVDDWVYEEGERIIEAYGNHPCFVSMACGNEPGGPHHKAFLSKWVSHFKERDPRRLYVGTAGWPELPENDFQVISEPRIHQWGDGLECRLNGVPPATIHDYRNCVEERSIPVVAHENGQWCAYPPLSDVGKYSGHLKPRNFEIFAEDLERKGMLQLAEEFVQASGKLQALCYKEEIESALRTPGFGGFQLLGLQDFSGQGTAPVGMLDAFWESKGYIDAAEMRRFCADRVVLARLERRVFSEGETFEAAIEIANYGPRDSEEVAVDWRLVSDEGVVAAKGELPCQTLPQGVLSPVGRVNLSLKDLVGPARYRLQVNARVGDTTISNDWDIWVYPKTLPEQETETVSVVSKLSDALQFLEKGEKVLLVAGSDLANCEIDLGFTPIFWNTACTQGQAPHTLGISCDPEHPAFDSFPTDFHTNWQWWYLLRDANPMRFDSVTKVSSIVRVIDDWYTNRDLSLLWETRVGNGKLLVSGIDLLDADGNIVKRQLLHSLLAYLQSDSFEPTVELSQNELVTLFEYSEK